MIVFARIDRLRDIASSLVEERRPSWSHCSYRLLTPISARMRTDDNHLAWIDARARSSGGDSSEIVVVCLPLSCGRLSMSH